MSQAPCEPIEHAIGLLTHHLCEIDAQITSLQNAALDQDHLSRYFALQRQIDRLVSEELTLQDKWKHAIDELASCREQAFFSSK